MEMEEVVRQDIARAAKSFGYTATEIDRIMGLYHGGCSVSIEYSMMQITVVEERPRYVPFADSKEPRRTHDAK